MLVKANTLSPSTHTPPHTLPTHYTPAHSPHRVAVDSLRIFLECTESQLMLERLESQNVWPLFEGDETYPHGMLHTARALSEEHHALNKEVVDALSSSLNSVYDDHRITVVAFYSEVGHVIIMWYFHAHTHDIAGIFGIWQIEVRITNLACIVIIMNNKIL